jgi:hypothetical protein
MDLDEALRLLKGGPEGVKEWNRRQKVEAIPNLSGANLTAAHLSGANLNGAHLNGAHLNAVHLNGTHLHATHLSDADLSGADLSGAILMSANLRRAILSNADLRGVICGGTIFADVDLSVAKGLDSVMHLGPSHLSTDTLIRSQGKIPEVFLRDCGVPDTLIEYLPSLIRGMQPIQFYSCFISYSSKDTPFAERLHADLQAKGIRTWFAPEDMKIGDEIRDRIDESIQVHDKLLLVLSEASVNSEWVRNEVETALERERQQQGRTVLFPVRLDDAVMTAPVGWAGLIRRRRHIGDFTRWKDHDAYQAAFQRLLRDLQAVESVGKA